tara:strand:- start:163 stop:330 length:168 start_codon:yes stop_codon:yes gene_type:complete
MELHRNKLWQLQLQLQVLMVLQLQENQESQEDQTRVQVVQEILGQVVALKGWEVL